MKKRRSKRSGRISRKLGAILFWMNIMALFFVAWTVNCETKAHVFPSYPRTELSHVLSKPVLTENDYQTLFRQTGLSSILIDKLRAQGREAEIYKAQEQYFQEIKVRCEPNTIISREEYVVDAEGKSAQGMHIVDVEDGDILITYCSHTFGWRNGHAALVIDAENRLTLEAQVLGEPSKVLSMDHWEEYPSFLVLRLTDASPEVRRQAARYAAQNLVGIPYKLTAGVREAAVNWPKRGVKGPEEDVMEETLTGTQCAHLVWYAYAAFGYDLDSDGGFLVTPYDLENSPLLEVVQSYGISEE